MLDLTDQVSNAFDNNNFVLGAFIDLSKAFDSVDHNIILEKLSMYGVKGNDLKWFHSYLSNRKKYIEFQNVDKKEITNSLTIKCGVSQGSILELLLFIVYVNHLYRASNILKAIMLVYDTNLFCPGKRTVTLFQTANIELEKIVIWFQANKLSLNESRAKFTLFRKSWDKDNLPLKLPILKINNFEIKRTTSMKFLGIMIDENTMPTLYFSFFNSCLNYSNIAWASTTKSKRRKIASQQRQAVNAIPKNNNQEITNSRKFME